ncbi:O-glycosyl hydrolase [Paenibacillus taihuensis]|uniref:O-glycosyl hydrolase n=1 Tax=Paenibacillus taihuensis TaxID=1156355 RepID=A0A3D9SDB3_9BACL|nr:glycoside hydrolase [Paenibacillus taihuensis]REE87390.1 O-glycosyl hydrolase [Paenibacillus taihuensis]
MVLRRLKPVSLALSILLLLSAAPGIFTGRAYAAAYTAVVSPSDQRQTVEGWGTSLSWWANMVGGWPSTTRGTIADLLFTTTSGIGLNVARYNISGGDNPSHTHLRPDAAVPGYMTSAGVYDWTRDANQRTMLSLAMARGANHVEAVNYSPPYFMTISGDSAGNNPGYIDNLASSNYGAFVDYLTEVVKHFRDSWGVNFEYLDPLNEPDGSWTAGGPQEGAHFDAASQEAIIQQTYNSLNTKGLLSTTKVTASDFQSVDTAVSQWNGFSSTTKNDVAKINFHTYGGSNRSGIQVAAATSGKKLWMSEYGTGGSAGHTHTDVQPGLALASMIMKDMKESGASVWAVWDALESESEDVGGNTSWGLIHADYANQTYNVTKQYYAMGNFSKYIREGYKIVGVNDANSLAAWDPASQKLVVVTLNNSSTSNSVTYDLSGFTTVGTPASAYRTSNTESLASVTAPTMSGKQFTATANANSITTYVISGVTYAPTQQTINDTASAFTYNGTWNYYNGQTGAYNNDVHYSNTTNSYFQVNFTGTNIVLSGPKSSDSGIMAVSVDGGTATNVDLYSASRVDNIPLWTSSTLASGAHTLKVTVTGTKNASSSNTFVSADSVTVSTAGVNLATNPGFEANGSSSQTITSWSTWPGTAGTDADADYVETSAQVVPHTGNLKLVHWKASAYQVYTYQVVTGLPSGLYTLKAWVQSSGGQSTAWMVAKNYGGSQLTANIGAASTWTQISIPNINVTNGTAEIAFYSIANANNWLAADDVEFYKQ